MLILGIESSCDETAVALVENGRKVIGSLVASQTAAHLPFGGVVPEVAAREHLRLIKPLYTQLLEESGVSSHQIDAVAVTQGPGLIGAILVGVAFAKGLALALGKPLIPVDHVHAHLHGALLGLEIPESELYPTLSLVVSGGHTNLYLMRNPVHFQLLACSIDDACGECFDKVAKLLNLGYPGGPVIEKLAEAGNEFAFSMPRMVSQRTRMEFSYSGLKTFMANQIAFSAPLTNEQRADLCASFQLEALGQIIRKLREGLNLYPDIRSVIVAGGVAANQRFRKLVSEKIPIPAFFPNLKYCSDNAAMIAAYGYYLYQAQSSLSTQWMNHDWDAYSRYDFLKAFNATA